MKIALIVAAIIVVMLLTAYATGAALKRSRRITWGDED